jgi:hypothetical protein
MMRWSEEDIGCAPWRLRCPYPTRYSVHVNRVERFGVRIFAQLGRDMG